MPRANGPIPKPDDNSPHSRQNAWILSPEAPTSGRIAWNHRVEYGIPKPLRLPNSSVIILQTARSHSGKSSAILRNLGDAIRFDKGVGER